MITKRDRAYATINTYLCSYTYHGLCWEFEIRARTMNEAAARVRAIRTTGVLDGEFVALPSVPLWRKLWRSICGRHFL